MIEVLESRIAPAGIVTITDVDGDLVTVEVKGPGTANVVLVGGAPSNANIDRIELSGTDLTSKLQVSVANNGPTVVGQILTTTANQHLGVIDLFPTVTMGDGTADANPDVRVSGKINEIYIVLIQANTIFQLGRDLPYNIPNDTKTPDTYNHKPKIVFVQVLGPGVEVNVIGDGVTPQGTGGGGIGNFSIGIWDFPGFIRTTQSIDKISVGFGNFQGTVEVDKLGLGAGSTANIGKFIVNQGAFNGLVEAEGGIPVFDADGFLAGATIRAGSLGKVTSSSNFESTVFITDPDSKTLPTFVVGAAYLGSIRSDAPIKKLQVKGDFSGSLEAPSIGSISAYAFIGSRDIGGVPTTFIRATGGGLGTLSTKSGTVSDFEIVTNLAFKGIKVNVGKLTQDTAGISNVHITAASIGNISVALKAAADAGPIRLVGIENSTFTTTASGLTKKDSGSIGDISVSLSGLANGVSAVGLNKVTFDALVGTTPANTSTANKIGKIGVKIAGSGGSTVGIFESVFLANQLGSATVDLKPVPTTTLSRALETVSLVSTGSIGALKFGGGVFSSDISAGDSIASLTIATKDPVGGTISQSKIAAGQGLVLNGADEKAQLAKLALARLGPVKITGAVTETVFASGAKIDAMTFGNAVTNSLILSGVNLGNDGTFDSFDTWQRAASIGKITVVGALAGTSISAGVDPGDAVFGNGDDSAAASPAFVSAPSVIAGLTLSHTFVSGASIPHNTAIQAGAIQSLTLGGQKIDPATLPGILDLGPPNEDAGDVLIRVI